MRSKLIIESESSVHSDRRQSRKRNQSPNEGGFRQIRARKQALSPNQGSIRTGARAESVTRVRMKGGFRQIRARKQA
ncbi:hypothetical protein, partial [Bacillus coreaensis]